jgi:hypothetical protein
MLPWGGTPKCVKIGDRYRRSCLDFSYPFVLFLAIILVFSNGGHHFTPYSMETHKNEDLKLLKGAI